MIDLNALTLTEVSVLATIAVALMGAAAGWIKGKQDGRRLATDSLTAALDRANSEIDRLLKRVDALEQHSKEVPQILAHLESVHSWVELGMRPPPPKRPQWLPPGEFSPLADSLADPHID